MYIIINGTIIYADGYILIPEEKTIQFFKKKSDLDYIPPIRINENNLSDFGKEILKGKINE